MKKFKNKYRIPSARLQSWDYSWNGAYFITICTKNKKHHFGEIVDHGMRLSHIGILADVLWHEIKNHASNTELGEYVIIPNHLHGILILNNNHDCCRHDRNNLDERNGCRDKACCRDKVCLVSTTTIPPPSSPLSTAPETCGTIGKQRFQNQGSNTISSIVGSYKSAVTKHAHRLGYQFTWQPRFHDHIIRNEKSFNEITEYVKTNPQKWENDKFYPAALS